MFIVLGATGHIGSVLAQTLLDRNLPVTAVLHDDQRVRDWESRGARVAVVDVRDSDALREVLRTGTRAFLLNPPADVASDTDKEERATADGIITALEGSGLEKVVLESTFGAQPGDAIGDLGVLYAFEQAALAQRIPVTIQRGAYYYSNWDAQVEEARRGTLTTMFPPDLKIPMVAPADLGRAAAERLVEPFSGDTDVHLVEGPDRYSVRDVADVFSLVLGRRVEVRSLPAGDWVGAYQKLGFSKPAAKSYAAMTKATIDGEFPALGETERGATSLQSYIEELVSRSLS
ncbi:MAG: NAD-dependent epimerase/dehydratase family protein [Alphaproteobacteria bacterium]|nr:MAG: NAD-dependent epimerase/dehydratase family protein [Alphaproteobacteria bacterium]